MIIVSSCLAGCECRYDGKSNEVAEIKSMVLENKAIALCPEQLGGLSTPRIPCEIVCTKKERRAIGQDQNDYTKEFLKGAEIFSNVAKALDVKMVILKANSPSCGYGTVYDGSHSRTLKAGNGFTADQLLELDIQIFNENNFQTIIESKSNL